MVYPAHPELFRNYLEFCNYRNGYQTSGKIDLSNATFFYPATLLPLLNLIIETHGSCLIEPSDPDVSNYLLTIIKSDLEGSHKKSYIPLVQLPKEPIQCDAVLQRIYELRNSEGFFRESKDAFTYVVSELVDNIYEHSGFKRAMVLAQKYTSKGFIELGFFDNGITIPGSFNKHGMRYNEDEHYKAIHDALKGLSTKEEGGRGYGLRTSVKIFLEGQGQVLIVSGSGAVYIDSQNKYGYILSEPFKLKGTLISLRVPEYSNISDIYGYIE